MRQGRKGMDLRKAPGEAHRSRYPQTRFGVFLSVNWPDLKARHLADEVGVSRQHIYRLRYDLDEPTLGMMIRLRFGCSKILGRRVWMSELFEMYEDSLLEPYHILPLRSQIG